MTLKIAVIGAGSIGFTRKLVSDILTVPELRDIRLSFMDIDENNLDMVSRLVEKDIASNGLDIKLERTLDQREAVRNANYIINTARIGRLDGFLGDIEIPLKYGVDQCVGDTLAAGGIMYGQRGVPYMLALCKDIREVGARGAMILNHGNPNAMMTWAANVYGGVRTLGLCHGVQGGHALIARALKVPVEELDIICAGINHQTWYIQARYKGRDMLPELLDAMQADTHIAGEEKTRIDVLKNFGYFSTESNGHLSEYLAWYRKRPEDMINWISMDDWHGGETGGYLRVCTESRNWFETDFEAWFNEPAMEYTQEKRSNEHGSYIIEALETGKLYRGHFNVMNEGTITNLPDECVVEVPGYIDANGINIPKVGDLPLGCAAVCSQSVWVQKLAVEAAVRADISLLYQAMLMDPLTGAVLNPPEVRQMTDEMLVAQAQWLPQYVSNGTVEKAKARLAGDYKTPRFEGYNPPTRKSVKSVAEVAASRKSSRVSAEDEAMGFDSQEAKK